MDNVSLAVDQPVAADVRGRAAVPREISSELAVARARVSDTDPVDSANSRHVGSSAQLLERLWKAASAGLFDKTIAALRQRLTATTVAGSFSAQPGSSDLTITVRRYVLNRRFASPTAGENCCGCCSFVDPTRSNGNR